MDSAATSDAPGRPAVRSGLRSAHSARDAAGKRSSRFSRRSGVLLEVVLSLSILLVAMSVVGLTFRNGEHAVGLADEITRADVLIEQMITEMVADTRLMEEMEQTGYFGEETLPGLSYRVEINPDVDIKGLINIDISIYKGEPDPSSDSSALVSSVRIQRVEAKGVNLEETLDQEQRDAISTFLEGLGIPAVAIDWTDYRTQDIVRSLPPEIPPEALAMLTQFLAGGVDLAQLDQLVKQFQSGDTSAFQDISQTAGQGGGGGGQ